MARRSLIPALLPAGAVPRHSVTKRTSGARAHRVSLGVLASQRKSLMRQTLMIRQMIRQLADHQGRSRTVSADDLRQEAVTQ